MFAEKVVQLDVILDLRSRLQFTLQVRLERLLPEDFAGQADAAAEVLPILGVGHVVELDARRGGGQVLLAENHDQFALADPINGLQGKFVKATIKKGEPREWQGKTYTDYEVGSFKQPF